MGFRARIFSSSMALLLVFGLVSGAMLEREQHRLMVAQVEHGLLEKTRLVRDLVEAAPPGPSSAAQDALADQLGASSGARVTFIRADGVVLGDSEVALADLPLLENHLHRPEVQEALDPAGPGYGVGSRTSASVGTPLLYLAMPCPDPAGGPPSVVRLSVPLALLDEATLRLRLHILGAGLAGLLAAACISVLAAFFVSRDLRALLLQAQARADEGAPPRVRPEPDNGALEGSFRRLADDLEQTVAALAAERNRLEAVLGGLRDAVVALDSERRIILMNPAGLELFGLTVRPGGAPGPVGRSLLDAVQVPALAALADEALAGEPAMDELELRAPGDDEGRGVRVLATATPQSGGGCVITLRDVTELRHLETVRRDFVANVSHELRTPVTAIRASAEALQDGALEDPELSTSFVGAILRNAERLTALIADLLSLSRIEAGHYDLNLEAVELAPLVQHVAETVVPRASADHQITVTVPAGLSAMADPGALEQVLINLLDNARKYTPPGGTIEVVARRWGSRVRLEVRDDGPGVPAQHRKRLFERFYRVDTGRSREMGGTGLGLAIVKHLVESMGGQVDMEPRHPRGSVFWVALPSAEG